MTVEAVAGRRGGSFYRRRLGYGTTPRMDKPCISVSPLASAKPAAMQWQGCRARPIPARRAPRPGIPCTPSARGNNRQGRLLFPPHATRALVPPLRACKRFPSAGSGRRFGRPQDAEACPERSRRDGGCRARPAPSPAEGNLGPAGRTASHAARPQKKRPGRTRASAYGQASVRLVRPRSPALRRRPPPKS